MQQYEVNVKIIDNDAAVEPQARLTPDPAEVEFSADDPAWKTFTVHTNLDSVLVRANPSGSNPALEVAGGQQVPSRAYCPAEGNDQAHKGAQRWVEPACKSVPSRANKDPAHRLRYRRGLAAI